MYYISADEFISISNCIYVLICFVGGQAFKLIMEYVPLGSLKEYLPRHKKDTSLSTLLSYSVQICKVTADGTGRQNVAFKELTSCVV